MRSPLRSKAQIADFLNASYKTIANNCTPAQAEAGRSFGHRLDAHRY
jgi:hypothetical protein